MVLIARREIVFDSESESMSTLQLVRGNEIVAFRLVIFCRTISYSARYLEMTK